MEILIYIAMLLLIVVSVAVLRSQYERKCVDLTEYVITSNKIEEDENFVFFADFHNAKSLKFQKKVFATIEKTGVNKVVVGGDLIVGKSEVDNSYAISFLKKLSENYKVYFVYGNHESRVVERKLDCGDTLDELNKLNITILRNAKVDFSEDKCIYGLEFEDRFYKKIGNDKPDVSEIEKRLGKATEKFNIVVCHKPDFFEAIEKYGADIVLSGHNHGGIIRLPFIGGVVSTSYRVFPKYSGGLYSFDNGKMILTRGLGTHSIHFRLFNKPEIVIVKIIKSLSEK